MAGAERFTEVVKRLCKARFGSDVQCFFLCVCVFRNPRADTDSFVFLLKEKKTEFNKTWWCVRDDVFIYRIYFLILPEIIISLQIYPFLSFKATQDRSLT